MPTINIPVGYLIKPIKDEKIKIRIRNTKFWIIGEKRPDNLWNAFLFESTTNYKELLRTDITTKSFAMFTNVILKSPFPYSGKDVLTAEIIKDFIKEITTK